MERIMDRIYKIVEDELPKQSGGLHPLGFDVCWGNWDIVTPEGIPAKNETFAIIFAFRNQGPRGEVMLGIMTEPLTTAHVLSGLWPPEAEIRTGVQMVCNQVRAYIQAQRAPKNGQGTPQGPVTPLRLPENRNGQ